jgi:hypothetical protein
VLQALQVISLLLVAVAMALALAHALELPGKLRLSKEAYMAMQPIYYPGFTIGGAVGEIGGLFAMLVLLLVTPAGTLAFWLTLAALLMLAALHGVYWVLSHPVNNFWLRDMGLGGAGERFFSSDPLGRTGRHSDDWTALRDRWEYSHVVRAALGVLSFCLLAAAVSA